jgi:hypothetical protein
VLLFTWLQPKAMASNSVDMDETGLKKFVLLEVGEDNNLVIERSRCIMLKKNELVSYNSQHIVHLKNLTSNATNKRKKIYKATVLLFHGKRKIISTSFK